MTHMSLKNVTDKNYVKGKEIEQLLPGYNS